MLNLKQIKTTIKLIRNAGVKLDQRINDAGVSIMNHANEHGDWSQMNALYEALPKSARRKAFVKWVSDHGPLKFDDKKGTFVRPVKVKVKTFDVEGANATAFWDYTKEVANTLDLDKLSKMSDSEIVAAFKNQKSKQAQKAIDNGTFKGNVTDFQTWIAA